MKLLDNMRRWTREELLNLPSGALNVLRSQETFSQLAQVLQERIELTFGTLENYYQERKSK